ncbi:chorion peroxidase [Folsomia candida]|uniref:Chorion peroxidase n=1 Tax=Folsomia candida TaxID=158441 RepID=A0A226DH01_FOLCA|nr:chorion peroxidase [Folsomia candida]OXA44238.1 Chorion peroxidase [Folsomia candida]
MERASSKNILLLISHFLLISSSSSQNLIRFSADDAVRSDARDLQILQPPGFIPNNGDLGIQLLLKSSVQQAKDFVSTSEQPDQAFFNYSAASAKGHGLGGHVYCKFTPTTLKIGRLSNINIKSYEILTGKYQIRKDQVLPYLTQRLPDYCKKEEVLPLVCNPSSRYRTIDGTCNNIGNPYWGSSFIEFRRLVPSAYEDGWNEPRGGGFHLPATNLPNVRAVSVSLHPDYVHPDQKMTNMIPQFGQFLDHDMTLTPESDKRCCSKDSKNMDCFPIRIPNNDYFFSQLEQPQECMDFTRSTPLCFPGSSSSPSHAQREQFNVLTAFVDASHVYASEVNKSHLLRAWYGGRFITDENHPGFLPTVASVQARAPPGEKLHFMGHFYGGEERVNEMPALTVMHTLFFREHNRLADQIAGKRPHWDDETIFQEARRILVAEWQNFVYGEYLPIIFGGKTMTRYGLAFDDKRIYTEYNSALDPSIFHAFADAAYRFGHTLLNGLIRMMKGFQVMKEYKIRDNFFDHEQITFNGGEGYDLILGGLMAQNSQTYDTFITQDVTNFLLKEKGNKFGGDLIARNLQRGRDHGLPGYFMYRALCDLPPLTDNWNNRPANIPENVWNVLKTLYVSPMDIDLFSGGLSEVPVTDGVTGHTFNCLKALQFKRAKYGDRYFFTHSHQAGSFTREQIQTLRRRTLGDVICENSGVEMTTKNVFKMPSEENRMISCGDAGRERLNVEMFLIN